MSPSRARTFSNGFLARFDIRRRLAALVVLTIVVTALISLFALRALDSVSDRSEESVVPIGTLSMIRADMKDVRIGTLNYVTSTDPKAKQTHKARKEKAQVDFEKHVAQYRPTSVDPATLDALVTAWAKYTPVPRPPHGLWGQEGLRRLRRLPGRQRHRALG